MFTFTPELTKRIVQAHVDIFDDGGFACEIGTQLANGPVTVHESVNIAIHNVVSSGLIENEHILAACQEMAENDTLTFPEAIAIQMDLICREHIDADMAGCDF